ncbi:MULTISPECIES: hypothetical protein [Bacillus]|uniref:hypothetical protein n=1 Tax=Bacillus TaxID=1386 RepID=UPI0008FB60AD|nr:MULTISPECIES: hypothetical protein [Bacillus]ARC72551.1 hypothetical protein B37_00498 [Bacillus licheniformis]ARW41686.1 hypothetical protein S100141_00363 [Bacillus licheniformis]ARW56536.1 hypothetical protein S100027_04572 [Bacillus licheniformis]AXF87805.1 hypothetical protein BLDA23_05770 [Bacillus licheniformis]MCA1182448.1 hypothetical protein [Bacillus licheniformis]
MKVRVKELNEDKAILEVHTTSGIKELVVSRTQFGHSYDDFSSWDISDQNYYDLEDLVDNVIARMSGTASSLEVEWEV